MSPLSYLFTYPASRSTIKTCTEYHHGYISFLKNLPFLHDIIYWVCFIRRFINWPHAIRSTRIVPFLITNLSFHCTQIILNSLFRTICVQWNIILYFALTSNNISFLSHSLSLSISLGLLASYFCYVFHFVGEKALMKYFASSIYVKARLMYSPIHCLSLAGFCVVDFRLPSFVFHPH